MMVCYSRKQKKSHRHHHRHRPIDIKVNFEHGCGFKNGLSRSTAAAELTIGDGFTHCE